MSEEAFFGLYGYHAALAALGAAVIAAYWLPRFVSRREPTASALLILFGLTAFTLVPGVPAVPDPRQVPLPWELMSELAVIVALFGAGLRIDDLSSLTRWRPTIGLLVVAMPLTILAVAVMGHALAGMTVAGAILLGAVLAPTDPVLAADVQVGLPLEGGEHPVRFALTTEAGLNDGLAFPFVYLGLAVAAHGMTTWSLGMEWFALDVGYRIAVGAVMGAGLGWLLGQVLFAVPRGAVLADTASGIVALAGVVLIYGATELLEGYGFIAVAVAGLTLRRVESHHQFHRRLHDFSEAIEHALTSVLLVALGGVLPTLLVDLDWVHAAIGLALLLLIRPAAGWLALVGTEVKGRDRAVVAFYGVRGIGSIYYLAFASGHIEFVNEEQLWALVGFVIMVSTLLHGLTAGMALESLSHDKSGREDQA